jgi:hypothetical protein
MSESRFREKVHAFQGMLHSGAVRIWANARHTGIVGLEALRTAPRAELVYAPEMKPHVTRSGVAAVFRIGGVEHRTHVPWTAMYRMSSRRGRLSWTEDAPDDELERLGLDQEVAEHDYYDAIEAVALECDPAAVYVEGVARIDARVPPRASSLRLVTRTALAPPPTTTRWTSPMDQADAGYRRRRRAARPAAMPRGTVPAMAALSPVENGLLK